MIKSKFRMIIFLLLLLKFQFIKQINSENNISSKKNKISTYFKHIFYEDERKNLDISNLWMYKFQYNFWINGVKKEVTLENNFFEFERNINIKSSSVKINKYQDHILRKEEKDLFLYSFSNLENLNFSILKNQYNRAKLNIERSKGIIKNFGPIKCFNNAQYEKEMIFLCVEKVPGFDFYASTKNEILILMICKFENFDCTKYKFNYGATAQFVWKYARFFGKFSSICVGNKEVYNPINLNDLDNKYNEVNSSLVSQAILFENTKDDVDKAKMKNFFEHQDENLGQKFDHCLLLNGNLIKLNQNTIFFSFSFNNRELTELMEFKINEEEKIIHIEGTKNITNKKYSIIRFFNLMYEISLVILFDSIYITTQNLLKKYIYNIKISESGSHFLESRKYISHYLDKDNLHLYIFCINEKRNIERHTYMINPNGTFNFLQSAIISERDTEAELFIYVHTIKSLVIYILRSRFIHEKKIKVCVDIANKLPFKRNCGFYEYITLNDRKSFKNFKVGVVQKSDLVILTIFDKFVVIEFKEPLYLIKIKDQLISENETSSQYVTLNTPVLLLQNLNQSSRVKRQIPNLIKNEFISNKSVVKSSKTENNEIELKIELSSENIHDFCYLILIISKDSNPIWWVNSATKLATKKIKIKNQQTFLTHLKGNFSKAKNDFFIFDYLKFDSIFIPKRLKKLKKLPRLKMKTQTFDFLERERKGIINLRQTKSEIEEIILFELKISKSYITYYALVKKKKENIYTIVQFDSTLTYFKYIKTYFKEGRFIGVLFNKELMFYDGENFYTKWMNFDNLDVNSNILKLKCQKVFLFHYDESTVFLLCYNGDNLSIFTRNIYKNVFDKCDETIFKDISYLNDENSVGIKSIGEFSKIFIHEMKSDKFCRIQVFKFKYQNKISENKKKGEFTDLGNDEKKINISQNSSKQQIIIELMNDWNINLIIQETINIEQHKFKVLSVKVKKKRCVVIYLNEQETFLANFEILNNYELNLLYKVSFKKLLQTNSFVKFVDHVDTSQFESFNFDNTLMLFKIIFKTQIKILFFFPERALLNAFPKLYEEKELGKYIFVSPLKLYSEEYLNKLLINKKKNFSDNEPINVFMFFDENNNFSLKKLKIFKNPFLELKKDIYDEDLTIKLKNQSEFNFLNLNLKGFDKKSSLEIRLKSKISPSSSLNISNKLNFPIEIDINLQNIMGNIFSYQIESENLFETKSKDIYIESPYTEEEIFKTVSNSLSELGKIHFDKENRIIYWFNKDMLILLDSDGIILESYFLNKYLLSSSRLLKEYNPLTEKENVFLNIGKNYLIRVLRSKQNTFLFLTKIITPFSKILKEYNREDIFSAKNVNQIGNLQFSLIHEKVFNENNLDSEINVKNNFLYFEKSDDSFKSVFFYNLENFKNKSDCSFSLAIEKNSNYDYVILKNFVFNENYESSIGVNIQPDDFLEIMDRKPKFQKLIQIENLSESEKMNEHFDEVFILSNEKSSKTHFINQRILSNNSSLYFGDVDEDVAFSTDNLNQRLKEKEMTKKDKINESKIIDSGNLNEKKVFFFASLENKKVIFTFYLMKEGCFVFEKDFSFKLPIFENELIENISIMKLQEKINVIIFFQNNHHLVLSFTYMTLGKYITSKDAANEPISSSKFHKLNDIRNLTIENKFSNIKNKKNIGFDIDVFYINNPFHIKQNKFNFSFAHFNETLILIQTIENKKSVLVYDLQRVSSTFTIDNFEDFTIKNSVGTIFINQIENEICQESSKSISVYSFYQTSSFYNFVLTCKRKIYLEKSESKFRVHFFKIKVPKQLSIKITSKEINSKYFDILYKNSLNTLTNRISLKTEKDSKFYKYEYIYLRTLILILFCFVYSFLIFKISAIKNKTK